MPSSKISVTTFVPASSIGTATFSGAKVQWICSQSPARGRIYMSANSKASRKARLLNTTWNTVIIGTGPAGCTVAKYLTKGGKYIDENNTECTMPPSERSVLMIDAGQRFSKRSGEHVKNSILFQGDHGEGRRLFAQFIASTLQPVSRNPVPSQNSDAFPSTWQGGVNNDPREPREKDFSPNLTNPGQESYFNLAGASMSYKVGGMGTHWTCACPKPHPELERNDLFPNDLMYGIGEELLHVNQDAYLGQVRNVLVRENLNNISAEWQPEELPLAVRRRTEQYVDWTGPDAILGDDLAERDDDNFTIADQLICEELFVDGGSVVSASVHDPRLVYSCPGEERFDIRAENFVVACGQTGSAQLLHCSNLDLPANGKYLTEQPFFFTRIILKKSIVDQLLEIDPSGPFTQFQSIIQQWMTEHPKDPVPIPRSGEGSGEVQQWIPVSPQRPWHVQIHQDNFFGQNTETGVDDRLVLGLRWFVLPEQLAENQVTFSDSYQSDEHGPGTPTLDYLGLPQATFDYSYTRMTPLNGEGMTSRIDDAYNDMLDIMKELGSPLPNGDSQIQFLENGSALHIHGCNRIGRISKEESVANENGLVWGTDNCHVVGNGVIPKGIACNPTLTAVCLAIRSAMDICGLDTSGTFHDS